MVQAVLDEIGWLRALLCAALECFPRSQQDNQQLNKELDSTRAEYQ